MQTLTDLSRSMVMEMDEKILDTQTEEYYTFGESVSAQIWCLSGRGHGRLPLDIGVASVLLVLVCLELVRHARCGAAATKLQPLSFSVGLMNSEAPGIW